MIKVLLFDFWGTLVETGVYSPTKQVQDMLRVHMPFGQYVVKMERAMMTQKFDSLREAFLAVGETFGMRVHGEVMEQLIGLWNKSWMLARPYEEIEEMLGELQKKYRLVLVSNSDVFSVPKVVEKYGLGKYFEKQFWSYEMGKIKTDEEFMQAVLRELNVDVQDCVFIGDSLHSDMAVATRAGMRGILMDRKSGREYSPKVKSLRELQAQL